MLVSITSALSNFDARYRNVDFNGIQRIVDTFSDPKVAAAVKADPNNFMITEMKKNNIPIPDGLHFHVRSKNVLFPPEPTNCVPPPTGLVLAAAPSKPYEVELLQTDGGLNQPPAVASSPGRCNSCFICIVFPLE